ncbi:hypothetical protein A3Q56_04558 [Intoshia linei]|uniref:Uncharacterized protein n=1 Tax=Intoshia linei TaxID=1819745 RepID=A0A177B256_9BILA|nr:hypothetical protein A3Q56_04558 [Intoshia linei]
MVFTVEVRSMTIFLIFGELRSDPIYPESETIAHQFSSSENFCISVGAFFKMYSTMRILLDEDMLRS